MKVLLHYEDHADTALWKSLKITLPKSWKNGPTSQLLGQFVETYNQNELLGGGPNPLQVSELHLAMPRPCGDGTTQLTPLASDAIVVDCLPDRADVYIRHGPAPPGPKFPPRAAEAATHSAATTTEPLVSCTRFGCQRRFPKGGPYPPQCQYHQSPPVFHETAKFWSCCPQRKAYDWDDFQRIPGCCQAECCTDVKAATGQPLFLGGTDLREKAGAAVPLKSIEDFNKAQAAGGSDAAPVLERLQRVLAELGIEKELYDQVMDGYRTQWQAQTGNAAELLEAMKKEIGNVIKASLKAVVVERLRIS
jgi:CHORD